MKKEIDPLTLTIFEALDHLRSGLISPSDLNEAFLSQCERLNPRLNAFITLLDSEVREQSHDISLSSSKNSPLYGIPVAIKDLFEMKGIRTTAGSLFLREYIPDMDSLVVSKLKEAGALIVGKTNTHEFAFGVTGVNPHYGTCLNPWDAARISGGSSSGSAVAVASGMALGAVGTDTGGSIRIPASLCGVVGVKPTYGRVPLRGVVPLSWNLDHAGPIAKTVKDAALLLQVMAGYDPTDPASKDILVNNYLLDIDAGIKDWNIALAVGDFIEEADEEVVRSVKEAARIFESLGARITPVNMDFLRDLASANSLMVHADAVAYHRERLNEHPDWFGADVRERLESGKSYSAADYSLARRKQSEGVYRMGDLFRKYDLVALPATPLTAPLIEGTNAIAQARSLTRFTAPFNLTGLPAMSIPCGYNGKGLPIGLQLVSAAWKEVKVFQAGRAFERETEKLKRTPPLQ